MRHQQAFGMQVSRVRLVIWPLTADSQGSLMCTAGRHEIFSSSIWRCQDDVRWAGGLRQQTRRYGCAIHELSELPALTATSRNLGQGFMFLANGDVHECQFRNGRADGPGTYVSVKGIEMKGEATLFLRRHIPLA